jgi:hypothetical protein
MPSPPPSDGRPTAHADAASRRAYHRPELKPYHAPQLSDLGALTDVTQSNYAAGSNVDAEYSGYGSVYSS